MVIMIINKTKLCSGPASRVHIGVWTVDMQSPNIQEWNQITPNYTMYSTVGDLTISKLNIQKYIIKCA